MVKEILSDIFPGHVSRDNGKLSINLYRKPTHTDRFLDFYSHHDKNHKTTTAATLIHRATNLPNSETGRDQEIKHVYTALESNGYPTNLISQITKKTCFPSPVSTPEELVGMVFKCVEPPPTQGFATLSYIKGLTEKQDIEVTNEPLFIVSGLNSCILTIVRR